MSQPGTGVYTKARAMSGWLRLDFNFVTLKPVQNQPYRWWITDPIVARACSLGFKIFATLAYAPPWAREVDKGLASVPASGPWCDFARQVALRYKGSIDHYGIWNEPNNKEFFVGTKEEYVAKVFKPAAQTIRATLPNIKIVAPDILLTGHWGGWQNYLRYVLSQGDKYIDVIAFHTYGKDTAQTTKLVVGPTIPYYEGDCLKTVVQLYLGKKEVWLTEVGWQSKTNEQLQASTYYDFMRWYETQSWINNMFIYELVDGVGSELSWGLLRSNTTAKPAYATVKQLVG